MNRAALNMLDVPVRSPGPSEGQARNFIIESWDDWGTSRRTAVIRPPRPVVAIGLGSRDQSGGVILTGSDLPAGGIAIGPGAPLELVCGGEPITVTSLYSTLSAGHDHRLELVLYYALPSRFAVRAMRHTDGQLSVTLGAAAEVLVPTFGRRRVRVMMVPSAEANLNVHGEVVGPGGAMLSTKFVDVNGSTAATPVVYEFDATSAAVGAIAGSKGWHAPDFVKLTADAGVGTATVDYSVDAWDE